MQEETLPPLIITRPGYYCHYKNLLYQVHEALQATLADGVVDLRVAPSTHI